MLLTLCYRRAYGSCIFASLYIRAHFTDYLCDRSLQTMGVRKWLSYSTSTVVCLAEMEAFPESIQSHVSFCRKMLFLLLNQNVQSERNLDGSFGAGVTDETQTSLVLHFDSSPNATLWHLGSADLALQDVTSVEESLVPTFAYLYSSAVTSPPLLCLCSINLQNRAQACDQSLELVSINQSAKQVDLDAFVPELNAFPLSACGLGCWVCLKQDQALKFGFYMLIALSRKKIPFEKTAGKC